MTLLSLVVALIIVGLLLWAVNALIPMSEQVKKVLNVVVVVFLVLWIMQGFGLINLGLRLK
jgi:hypothetical protein